MPTPNAKRDSIDSEAARAAQPILELRNVCKAFARASGEPLPVLAQVGLQINTGEIVGLLGRSGSGKSTLLRIAAGLITPDAGEVLYKSRRLTGPEAGIAVVFQTFALYPWLTVERNVELGLDALRLPQSEVTRRVRAAIDLIGLDGFQSAYPRELSGGMRQRVGFARAIVAEPTLLLMDEPFSALDVLTAETLRTDFLDLWIEHRMPTKAALLVTHNIEEAVLMCNRIVVLGTHPGHIAVQIPVPLLHPRDRQSATFRSIVDEIYSVLIERMAAAIGAQSQIHGGRMQALPPVSVNRIAGFLETVAASATSVDLASIAKALSLEINELLPIAAALHILEFAELKEATIALTAAGKVFADSSVEDRKRLFREHLLRFVPLAVHIHQVLEEREDHRAPRDRFELELQDHLRPDEAERTLLALIGWGRYAELFRYDDESRTFELGPQA
jgi:NitT/TauT family transport system ATP-binding protein